MMPMGIPDWNDSGVLPPRDPRDPTSPNRSPYVVRLSEVVQRFGLTTERLTVLDGFLQYREALHTLGLTRGFQWLDGSFLEDVELLERRSPNDIDVVTFFRLLPGMSQAAIVQQAPDLFPDSWDAQQRLKQRFHVDAYLESLDAPSEIIIEQSIYWYSMWSHRRSLEWKGFVQLDLAPREDVAARELLVTQSAGLVQL